MKEFAVKLVVVLVASIVMRFLISQKFRNKITPYVFAFTLASPTIVIALHGWPAVIVVALGYLARAFLLDGCQLRWLRDNPVIGVFILFWLYMVFSMTLGDYSGYASMYYFYSLFESVLVGYFVGMWMLRNPGQWGRLLRIVSVTATLCLIFYMFHGVFSSAAVDDQGRATISVMQEGELVAANQNYLGLLVVALLPYPFLLILGRHSDYARHAWIKIAAYCTFVLMAVALVRTGSRNASLGLLPILAYLFFAKTSLRGTKKIVLRSAIVLSVLVTLAFSAGTLEQLRIFTAKEESGDITSGRLESFQRKLYGRNDVQKWFGCGGLFDYRFFEELGLKRPPMSNGHSMYFQIYYQSGNIGVFLLVIAILAVWCRARKLGARGHIIMLLFFVWAFCGAAESMPLLSEGLFKPLLGIALSFCTKLQLPGLYQIEGNMPPQFYSPPYPLPYYA